MKVGKFCKGVFGVLGGMIFTGLSAVEEVCDSIGADIDCPPDEYDARQEAVRERQKNNDYFCTRVAEHCFDYASDNFSDAFQKN